MSGMGDALMGIGRASGDHRAIEAAQNALNSPILEGMSIYGAQGLLVNVTGGSGMTMFEVSEAVAAIEQAAGDEVNLIHGVVIDERMEEEIAITVVATGFHRQHEEKKTMVVPVAAPVAGPIIEIVRQQPDRDVTVDTSAPSPAPPAPSTSDVDVNDINVPTYLRRQREREQDHRQTGMPHTEPPSSSSVPVSAADPSQPQMRRAAASSQPAFLRKIMD
jgi:cell division protein FtsZ